MTNNSISSVSGASSATGVESTSSNSQATKLTTATKLALQALGVDTTNITTESQGQIALTSAKSAENTKQAHAPKGNSSEDSIKASAKTLAAQVGATVSDDDKADEVLTKVSAKIDELRSSAGEDKTKLEEVNNYQAQLDGLSNSLSSTKAAQSQLSGSMNNMANLNKVYQNLT